MECLIIIVRHRFILHPHLGGEHTDFYEFFDFEKAQEKFWNLKNQSNPEWEFVEISIGSKKLA